MSVNVGTIKDLPQNSNVAEIGNEKKPENKASLRQTILTKLCQGKDFILSKLNSKTADTLIKTGQCLGTTGIVLGALASIFTGIGATLSIAGIPLAIPLLVGGAVLFTAGTGTLIARIATNANSTLGEKIKELFTTTGLNLCGGVRLALNLAKRYIGKALKDIIKENGSEIIAEGKATLEATDKANKQDIGEAIKEIEPQIKDIAKDISELKSALNNPENKK